METVMSDIFDHFVDAGESLMDYGFYGRDPDNFNMDAWVKRNHPENYETYKFNKERKEFLNAKV
jgi:hypothetical protein